MKRTVILLKVFFISLIILQGCNNIKHKTDANFDDIREREKKILIFFPDLNDKYRYEKLWYLNKVQTLYDSYFNIQTYNGSLILGKRFNEKYDSFINEDIYKWCRCILFNDGLYIEISNGSAMAPHTIYLKIEKNKYEIIVIMSSDCNPSIVLTSTESALRMSSNEFHIGDTIIGEIFLSHRDSILIDDKNYLFGYECDGHFMGVIDQGNEEWEKVRLHTPSGKSIFEYK